MAQLPKKPEPTYQHDNIPGIYRITYQAASGAKRQGIPHDDMTDIVNLVRVAGPVTSPAFIVTSEADFKTHFTERQILKTAPHQTHRPEAGKKE